MSERSAEPIRGAARTSTPARPRPSAREDLPASTASPYGASRQAAGTTGLDKRTYQLNPANPREALADALLDEQEGADALMVKPAGPYLDILFQLRQATRLPIAAYQVSGEYAQIHAAARLGWLDLERCRHESLIAIKRAGADLILTYFAKDMAAALR